MKGAAVPAGQRRDARLSEATLRSVLADVADGILVVDEAGAILFANPAAEALLGSEQDELLTSPFGVPLVANEMIEVDLPAAADAGGRNRVAELRCSRTTWGDRPAYVVALRDVTERKQLLRSLQRQRARLSFLAEAGAVLGTTLDYQRTLENVARLAVPRYADWCLIDLVVDGELRRHALLHVDPSRVRHARQLRLHRPPPPKEAHPVHDVLRSGRSRLLAQIDTDFLSRFASDAEQARLLQELRFRSAIFLPLTAHGQTLGVITMITTEESRRSYTPVDLSLGEELGRRAGLAIENARLHRQAQERAHAAQALSHIGEGVILLDSGGRIRLLNPAAERLTGLKEDDVRGQLVEDVIADWGSVQARVSDMPASEAASPVPVSVPLTVDDHELWLLMRAVRFPTGVVYTFSDITNERDLHELQREFIATASHELRTPLTSIYGAAKTLQRPDTQLNDNSRRQLIDLIGEQTDRLREIADDLLAVSQIEAGGLSVHREEVDPRAAAEEVVEFFQGQARGLVLLEFRAEPDLPPVAGDPQRLRQVLVNLVENAIKYSPEGGDVVVAVRSHLGQVEFAVSDQGIGIPPAKQQLIFEKFYRADPDLDHGIGGTGLGLYICRELVERMHGTIGVTSQPGQGSTFSVRLPRADRG